MKTNSNEAPVVQSSSLCSLFLAATVSAIAIPVLNQFFDLAKMEQYCLDQNKIPEGGDTCALLNMKNTLIDQQNASQEAGVLNKDMPQLDESYNHDHG